MSYFARYPFIKYGLGNGVVARIQDITIRTKVLPEYKENDNFFLTYTIKDGETPEMIADRFYDDIELAWVILHYNEIHSVYEDWPCDHASLERYIESTYSNPHEVRFNISAATGNVVGDNHPDYDKVPVTHYEYEMQRNDSKRMIDLILPEYVSNYIRSHTDQVDSL